jgi:hypothetical protein
VAPGLIGVPRTIDEKAAHAVAAVVAPAALLVPAYRLVVLLDNPL